MNFSIMISFLSNLRKLARFLIKNLKEKKKDQYYYNIVVTRLNNHGSTYNLAISTLSLFIYFIIQNYFHLKQGAIYIQLLIK